MIALGGTNIVKAFLGSTELKNIAIGDELLMSQASPYDEFGYVKNGKTFHLDGINVGTNTGSWTDLAGGVIFPLVNGVTHDTNHVNFVSGHGIMESSPRKTLDFGTTGTLEVVCECGTEMGVIFTGKNNTLGCIFYGKTLTPMIWRSHYANTYNIETFLGQTIQMSYTIADLYINNIHQTAGGTGSMNVNVAYCVIGNGNGGSNRPYIGNIYSIRYYNRVLTDEERANNLTVDRQRFNLTLA